MSSGSLVDRLRSAGPGLVFALTVLGPGDFVSNATIGASQGYALLWAVALSLVFRYIWLDTSARYVLATGETPIDGYRRLSGVFVWAIFAAMLLVRTLSNLYKLVLLGNLAELLLPISGPAVRWGAAIAAALLAYSVCTMGRYKGLEKLFKPLIALMGCALLVAAAFARPDPAAILQGLTWPRIPGDSGLYSSMFLLMALIGTEAGSITNLTYSYFMWQKGWRDPSYRSRQRADLWLSVSCLFVMSASVQIAAAGTLLPAGVSPARADDLVPLFSQALGTLGRVVFAFGLCASALSGMIGTTAGYALMATDVWGKLRRMPGGDPGWLYRGFVAFWCFAPLGLLAFAQRPVWLVLAVSALMAALIPLMATLLLILTADRRRLGQLAPPRWAQVALAILVMASSVLIGLNVHRWLTDVG
jgi:Mn2+/Fe2+ NRAMP family transporter